MALQILYVALHSLFFNFSYPFCCSLISLLLSLFTLSLAHYMSFLESEHYFSTTSLFRFRFFTLFLRLFTLSFWLCTRFLDLFTLYFSDSLHSFYSSSFSCLAVYTLYLALHSLFYSLHFISLALNYIPIFTSLHLLYAPFRSPIWQSFQASLPPTRPPKMLWAKSKYCTVYCIVHCLTMSMQIY